MDRGSIFAEYAPPFDLVSDLLFVFALAPSAPFRATFPSVSFLSVAGRIPLVIWFGRVKAGTYRDPATGALRHLGGSHEALYNELNVLAPLRRRAGFVPGIYATSALTIAVGHGYGMPKQPAPMALRLVGRCFQSAVEVHGRRSFVRAWVLGSGRGLGRAASRFWPWWTWPALFPGGRSVRAEIQATPRIHPALLRAGRLALDVPWLPRPVALWPFGLYLPDQRMRLPPP